MESFIFAPLSLKLKILPLLLGISFFWLACENTTSEGPLPQKTAQDTLRYASQSHPFVSLSPAARELVKDWPIFQDFEREIMAIKNNSLDELKVKTERLLAHTDSLSQNIPDTLFTNTIQARLTIIKTRMHLLNQEVNKGKPVPQQIETSLNQTWKAIDNFVMQINEKVQKDRIDLQRKDDEDLELSKQKKATDSIYELERQDHQEKPM